MFSRDLVAKYGKSTGYGVSDTELRKALRLRALVFLGGGAVAAALVVLGFIYLPVVMLGVMIGGAIIIASVSLFVFFHWLAAEFPDHLRTIKRAKNHGVWEHDK